MNLAREVTRGHRLLAQADDQNTALPKRMSLFTQGADLLMSAATMSDDVGQVDRILNIGDGIVTTHLLMGEGLFPPTADLVSAYLWLAEGNLELFEFRMRLADLRDAENCLNTVQGLLTLTDAEDPSLQLRSAVARARLSAYRAETFGETAWKDHLHSAVRELEGVGNGDHVASGWRARCLRLLSRTTPDPEPALREAIHLLQQALQAPLRRKPTQPWVDAVWGADLVSSQLALYALTGEQSDLIIAFNWARQTMERRKSVPAQCAYARALRAALGSPIGVDLDLVEDWHRALILVDGRNWYGWLLAREHATWCRDARRSEGVVQARYVYDIALQVASVETTPTDRQTWLHEIAALAPLVTDRLVQDDTPSAAGFRLERCRSLYLQERFADEYAELRGVTAAGHGSLAADLREALDASRSRDLGARGHDIAADRVNSLSAQLRQVPGFERFRAWLEPEEVAEAAGDDPLIYLIPGPSGGWAVGHDPEQGWFHRSLPLCRTDEIPGPVQRFRRVIRDATIPAGARRHAAQVITAWLHDAIYAPLRPHMAGRVCHVVAHGYLGGLPLHAARPADGSVAGALHESDIRYVPSARALAQSRRTLQTADPDDQVFLGVPPPEDAGIASAAEEMSLVARWFPRAVILQPEERSRADIVRAARTAGWLHASCHGVADPSDPLASGLLLAGGERLTLGDLARADTEHLTLAVLSACQTAVADPELPDEELSLAAGFLSAGCGAVVASSWPVPDRATGELMTHFYNLWRGDGLPVAEALRRAQQHLADGDEGAGSGDAGAWRGPYFWAGFRYLGW